MTYKQFLHMARGTYEYMISSSLNVLFWVILVQCLVYDDTLSLQEVSSVPLACHNRWFPFVKGFRLIYSFVHFYVSFAYILVLKITFREMLAPIPPWLQSKAFSFSCYSIFSPHLVDIFYNWMCKEWITSGTRFEALCTERRDHGLIESSTWL